MPMPRHVRSLASALFFLFSRSSIVLVCDGRLKSHSYRLSENDATWKKTKDNGFYLQCALAFFDEWNCNLWLFCLINVLNWIDDGRTQRQRVLRIIHYVAIKGVKPYSVGGDKLKKRSDLCRWMGSYVRYHTRKKAVPVFLGSFWLFQAAPPKSFKLLQEIKVFNVHKEGCTFLYFVSVHYQYWM